MNAFRLSLPVPSAFPSTGGFYSQIAVWTCVLGLCCSTGCSREVAAVADEASRHPVAGTVLLDGEPGERIVMTFIPRTGTPGLGGYAIVDAAGKFSVIDFNKKAGLQKGEYYVTFSKRVMTDGTPIPENVPDGIDTKELLPPSMTNVDPDTHRYIITVSDLSSSLDFDLSTKRR